MVNNRYGVLIIAHGSSNSRWKEAIKNTVESVSSPYPIALSYLEFSEDKTIKLQVQLLESLGVNHIIAIPLFISTGSTHIAEIKYMLGISQSCQVETDVKPISINSKIILCNPMDDHPLIVELLLDQLRKLSVSPNNEAVLLVGHGSDRADFFQVWEDFLKRLESKIQSSLPFGMITHATMYNENIDQMTRNLRNQYDRLIVLPLFLYEGYFTKRVIPQRLGETDYIMGHTYIPHQNIRKWIEHQVESTLVRERKQL